MAKYDSDMPCPCGSGRRISECCRVTISPAVESSSPENLARQMNEEIRRRIGGRHFATESDFQLEVNRIVDQINHRPCADFCGLSPAQIFTLHYRPFTSPDLVRFADNLDPPPEAPVLQLYFLLARACATAGLKATVTGNLPRNFVKQAADIYWLPHQQAEADRFLRPYNETRFVDLHIVRIIAELAGLVRKRRGRFQLTRKADKLAQNGATAIYHELFFAYCDRLNWAYFDYDYDFSAIQESFLFTLYLLHLFGDRFHAPSFYEDKFLTAFPNVTAGIEPTPYETAAQRAKNCFERRALFRFARLFGLAEIKTPEDNLYFFGAQIRKAPLLDRFVIFSS